MAPPLRIRTYANFLTPALHRRFSRAAASLLILCYVESIILGGGFNSLFWSWFPFGKAGIRTGLLFICAFAIFILRVAQLHVGLRTTRSGFETFKQYALRYQTIQTGIWYIFSAWLYSEIYIFSAPNSANIKWITDAKNAERPRLNERPIYLTTYFIFLAITQAGCHIYYDYDRIDLPVKKTKPEAGATTNAQVVTPPYVSLRAQLPSLAVSSIRRSLTMSIASPVIYLFTVREFVWSWTLMFAKLLWNLPKATSLPLVSPFHWTLLIRTWWGGAMLIMIWEVANAAFTLYVAQEPLKNERPLTYESRDPNGSLLTGLKGKKLQTRAFAFWELVYISDQFQGRRKTIFEDIDRAGGSSWSQILGVCLGVISDVNVRVTNYNNPPPVATSSANTIEEPGLPRLTKGLREDNIYNAGTERKTAKAKLLDAVNTAAKGVTPSSPLENGRKLLDQAKHAVLSPGQDEKLSPEGIWTVLRVYALQVLQSPIGVPFRQEFRRRAAVIVLGRPYGDVGIVVDAIDTLARLSVSSLKEDPYGNVQRDVAAIIRTFTSMVINLETFKAKLGFHWTDIEEKRESPEIDAILASLRSGLQELVAGFGDYASDLRLSHKDLRLAKEAATTSVEMKQK